MRAIIPVHALPGDGTELRYSLRSMKMYAPQIDEVILLGEKSPTWYVGPRIDIKQDPKLSGVSNVMRKLHVALKDIQGGVCITSDDQYWLKPWKILPPRHMSSSPLRKSIHDSGFRRAQAILEKRGVEYKYDYELHCPMVMDAQRLWALLDEEGYDTPLSYRTLYGNIYWAKESVPLMDVKSTEFIAPRPERPYYSSSDMSVTNQVFLTWCEKSFPVLGDNEVERVPRPRQ